MNSRQRFLEVVRGGQPDHPPLFPEGLREHVLENWLQQGLASPESLEERFAYDPFEELLPDVYPRPEISDWSDSRAVLRLLRQRLDPHDPKRLPEDWSARLSQWRQREYPLFLRLHPGLFLSLGIEDWRSFAPSILRLVDEPEFVHEVMALQSEFATRLAENILSQVDVDGFILSEPIAGNHGALVSPRMYRAFALNSYAPIFEVARRYAVPARIWRSYANPACLIPEVVASGFNVLWLCETPAQGLDASAIRRLSGEQITLIGGFDVDLLRQPLALIQAAVQALVPHVAGGYFIPLADGRVREEAPFENYSFYRQALERQFIQPISR